MEEIDYISINKELYNRIIGFVGELSSQHFKYLNLSDEIANSILVKLFKASVSSGLEEPSPDFIKSMFPKAVEEVFSYYQKVSYQYCITKTHDHSLSEDSAQEAIQQLLSSQQKINDVYPWLRQVTHNLLCKHYESKAKEQELYNSLCMESSILQHMTASSDFFEIEGLSPTLRQQIIASAEYRDYESMVS